jgi:hypothetical protein
MMVGGRFDVGGTPKGLSDSLVARMREAEESLSAEERSRRRWTLTWLEGRATVTLDEGPSLRD